jgi:predicted nuclease with RNAse H fold
MIITWKLRGYREWEPVHPTVIRPGDVTKIMADGSRQRLVECIKDTHCQSVIQDAMLAGMCAGGYTLADAVTKHLVDLLPHHFAPHHVVDVEIHADYPIPAGVLAAVRALVWE